MAARGHGMAAARIRTPGPAMARPRAYGVTALSMRVRGRIEGAARSADRFRRAPGPAALAPARRQARLRQAQRPGRRRRVRIVLPRQQQCHRIGSRSRRGHADDAGHDRWVLPPLQAARRQAGTEPLHTAAERHDGAGQLRPVRMARTDPRRRHIHSIARPNVPRTTRRGPAPSRAAGPAGRGTRPAHHGSGGARWQGRAQEKGEQGEEMDEPVRPTLGASGLARSASGEEASARAVCRVRIAALK